MKIIESFIYINNNLFNVIYSIYMKKSEYLFKMNKYFFRYGFYYII